MPARRKRCTRHPAEPRYGPNVHATQSYGYFAHMGFMP